MLPIENPTSIERDTAIQRFEFTFETTWKAAKQMLFDIDGMDVGSPKGVIRACHEVGLLNGAEATDALQMVDDRNLTIHTYNDALAIGIYERLKAHVASLKLWLDRIKEKVNRIK